MDSTIILDLALIILFYWMAFRALSTGRIRLNSGIFSRAEKAWCYWAFVSLYPVSYTHLDVYKRQYLEVVFGLVRSWLYDGATKS